MRSHSILLGLSGSEQSSYAAEVAWSWLAARRPADDWSYLSSGAMYLNTVMGIGLLLVATLFPPMQAILETVNLTAQAWSATILFALFSFLLTSLMQDY